MILDFQNIEDVKRQVESGLNSDTSIPEWKKEIFNFLEWYYSLDGPLLQKTSGSTDIPKEIKLSREVLSASAEATIAYFKLAKRSSALLCIPAKFIGGKMMLMRAILGEWKLTCTEPKGNLSSVLAGVSSFDFTAMIPLQVQKLLNNDVSQLNKIKNLIIGGAAVSDALENELCNAKINAYSTYGMTETASHVALKKLDGKSNFQALAGISFSIDTEGRLSIEGLRLPESKLLTNDLVKLISETSFHWLGRIDNVINSGGVKIVAEELEKTIATQLNEAFYITKEIHSELGETPVLVIECEAWESEKTSVFLESLKPKLPDYWSPRKIRFVVHIDRTASGKIKRI